MALDAGEGLGGATFAFGAGGGCVLRTAPMMKKKIPIPIAEIKRDFLRPSVSTPIKMKVIVEASFITPEALSRTISDQEVQWT